MIPVLEDATSSTRNALIYPAGSDECGDLTVVDLFCGAGGFSLGFSQAGFRVLSAVDNEPAAIEIYNANMGPHAVLGDLNEHAAQGGATVFVGGPPCQGFSSAGLRRQGDRRNTLVSRFAQLVLQYRPRAFVFENVEGFLTGDDGEHVFDLLSPLIGGGYRTHMRKVNVANYGVPQHRKRVVAIGCLGWDPTFPAPTHTAYGAPGAHLAARHLPGTPTLSDTLDGLPSPTTREPALPHDHIYRPLQGIDLERARALMPGQTMRDLPPALWHASYQHRAFRRVMDGTPTERRGGAPSGIRRLRPDQPAKAITGGARSEFIHPVEDRPLTLRECARIQTFPDTFRFCGTAAERAQLIGNAVPPLFAAVLARSLAAELSTAQTNYNDGALLSFVPTLSSGMSPALERITVAVHAQFLGSRRTIQQRALWD